MSVARTVRVDPQAALPPVLEQADTRDAPPAWDSILAGLRVARDDTPGHFDEEQTGAYMQLYSQLLQQGRPQSRYYSAPDGINPVWNTEAIWADAVKAGLVTKSRDEFDRDWQDTMRARMARDAATVARSKTVPWLIGSIAGSLTDPINIATLPLGGGTAKSVLQLGLREAALNAAIEGVEQPLVNAERLRQGRPGLTGEEALANIGVAGVAGFVLPTSIELGGKAVSRISGTVERSLPLDRRLARALGKESLADVSDADIARAFRDVVPEDMRIPDESSALHVLDRQAEIDGASPFIDAYGAVTANRNAIADAQARIDSGATVAPPRALAPVGREARETVKARIAQIESGGRAVDVRNPASSATGKYQFIDDTWLGLFRARFGEAGLTKAQILAKRGDPVMQNLLMDDLLKANEAALARAGVPDTAGNLYLAHFAGSDGAIRLHRAPPGASARSVLGDAAVNANPFLEGMTARDVIAWADRKMGGKAPAFATGGGDGAMEAELQAALAAERADIEARRLRGENDMLDAEAGLDFEAVPELRRGEFPEGPEWEPSWRIAQSELDAERFGYERPAVTRQTIWEEAQAQLTAAKAGDYPGGLFHRDVGPIDVKWGSEGTGRNDGFGLAKLIRYHPEVIDRLPGLLDEMEVVKRTANRIQLESPTHRAGVRLDWDGGEQTWLLTAFEKDSPHKAMGGPPGEGASPATEDNRAAGAARAGNAPALEAGSDIGAIAAPRNAGEARLTVDDVARAARTGELPEGFSRDQVERFAADNAAAVSEAMQRQAGETAQAVEAQTARMADAPLEPFADPAGGASVQAMGLDHDVRARIDAGELDGLDFATGVDGAAESPKQALARLDADDAALKALRECL